MAGAGAALSRQGRAPGADRCRLRNAAVLPVAEPLIGPMNGMVIGDMQRRMALVSCGKLHLQLRKTV